MTTLDRPALTRPPAYRLAVASIVLGVLSALLLAALAVFGTSPSGTDPYRYASQYWFTGSALPIAAAAILVLWSVRRLHDGRDGRLGLIGVALATVCLLALMTVCGASVLVGHDIQGGPTYVLATAGTFVGMALFSVGCWRAGLVPRWLLAVWPFVWLVGSFASVNASPLLLAALYVVLFASLRGSREAPAASQ